MERDIDEFCEYCKLTGELQNINNATFRCVCNICYQNIGKFESKKQNNYDIINKCFLCNNDFEEGYLVILCKNHEGLLYSKLQKSIIIPDSILYDNDNELSLNDIKFNDLETFYSDEEPCEYNPILYQEYRVNNTTIYILIRNRKIIYAYFSLDEAEDALEISILDYPKLKSTIRETYLNEESSQDYNLDNYEDNNYVYTYKKHRDHKKISTRLKSLYNKSQVLSNKNKIYILIRNKKIISAHLTKTDAEYAMKNDANLEKNNKKFDKLNYIIHETECVP